MNNSRLLHAAARGAPELTFEEFCALPFVYCAGMTGDWGAQRMYRNSEHGLQIEVVTKRKRYGDLYGGWRKEKRGYYMDNDPAEYATIDQLYVAYMAKVCGVTP